MSPSSPSSEPDRAAQLSTWLAEPLPKIAGVGPVRRARLKELLGTEPRRRDALLVLPERLIDLQPIAGAALVEGAEGAFWFRTVGSPARVGRRGRTLAGVVDDVALRLLWFHQPPAHLLARITDSAVLLSGKVRRDGQGELVCAHPRLRATSDAGSRLPVYPGLDGALSRILQSVARALLGAWPEGVGEPLRRALSVLHGVEDGDVNAARQQLAQAEWCAFRLEMAAAGAARRHSGRKLDIGGRLAAAVERDLPFVPTASQRAVWGEIRADLTAGSVATRLVSGDVGTGKTLVAALAAADVVEAGRQALLLAPSESLARQHASTLHQWLDPHGVDVALLTGSVPTAARGPLLERLRDHRLHVVVGTHALLEERVAFHDLGLAIVDEQQRFGVRQRALLATKGLDVHLLALTATPIPRTLALMLEGSLSVSSLAPRPDAHRNVLTRAIGNDREDDVIQRLADAIAAGERAFWVCPRINGDQSSPGVLERTAAFERRLPGRVASLTGRTAATGRDAELRSFRDGTRPLLVATTVIEVGIDVPDASIIVIENAERFGLAQLHQLRGRVGRGGQPASCVLLHGIPLAVEQRARLDLLRRCHDGLALAEADLEARGRGDLLGLRQSGSGGFRVLDLASDAGWLSNDTPADEDVDPRALFPAQPTGTGGVAAG